MAYSGSETQKFFGLNTNGILVATSNDTYAAREITAGTGIAVANGNGVAGNIQISLSETVPTLGNNTPLALGPTASVGVATTAMRSDAVIQFPLATVSQTLTAAGSLAASDHGRVVEWNSANAALTLPANLPAGFNCLVLVTHATGIPTFTAGSGAVIRQSDGLTKARKQWSLVSVVVRNNVGGSAAEYVLSGDMS